MLTSEMYQPLRKMFFIRCANCHWDEHEEFLYSSRRDVIEPAECPNCSSVAFVVAYGMFEVNYEKN